MYKFNIQKLHHIDREVEQYFKSLSVKGSRSTLKWLHEFCHVVLLSKLKLDN